MSQQSKLRKSRTKWKHKARQRADNIRYLRKELAKTKAARDHNRDALKKVQSLLRQKTTQSQGVVRLPKIELVFLAITLFAVAHIGFRAVSRVLGVLAEPLGIKKAPSPQTIINWVTKLSLVRIQSASSLVGTIPNKVPFSNGLIWMIDSSIGLGSGKILAVVAFDVHYHKLHPNAPCLRKIHCIAVSVADSWTGEKIAEFLQRIIAVMGRPTAYLKDGGTDLKKAHRLIGEQGQASMAIDDISHMVATILKRHYQDQPTMTTFLSACGRVSKKFKQTILACLVPPKVQTKARFMNVHRLFTWADRLLNLSPGGHAPLGSTLAKLHSSLDQLPECKMLIQRFRNDASVLLECQKILKNRGLSHKTYAQCKPLVDSIPSFAVRLDFSHYLQSQLKIATTLGLAEIGMPISSDAIESLFGLAKQHGTGEIKDANRMALRLPAICGVPTRAEAQQIVKMSVAQQNELTGRLTSLTKQRREVFSNPESLEKLGTDHAHNHIELIPRAKNRSNYQKIIDISNGSKKESGPQIQQQEWLNHPVYAAS